MPIEDYVVVECTECDLREDANNYNDLITFVEKHKEHTGHETRWSTETPDPDFTVIEDIEYILECSTCNDKWTFEKLSDAAEYKGEHSTYTDHKAGEVSEKEILSVRCNLCGASETFEDNENVEEWCENHGSQSEGHLGIVSELSSVSQRERIKNFKNVVAKLEEEYEDGAPVPLAILAAEEQGWSQEKADRELDKLKQKGEVYEPATGYLRTT